MRKCSLKQCSSQTFQENFGKWNHNISKSLLFLPGSPLVDRCVVLVMCFPPQNFIVHDMKHLGLKTGIFVSCTLRQGKSFWAAIQEQTRVGVVFYRTVESARDETLHSEEKCSLIWSAAAQQNVINIRLLTACVLCFIAHRKHLT